MLQVCWGCNCSCVIVAVLVDMELYEYLWERSYTSNYDIESVPVAVVLQLYYSSFGYRALHVGVKLRLRYCSCSFGKGAVPVAMVLKLFL